MASVDCWTKVLSQGFLGRTAARSRHILQRYISYHHLRFIIPGRCPLRLLIIYIVLFELMVTIAIAAIYLLIRLKMRISRILVCIQTATVIFTLFLFEYLGYPIPKSLLILTELLRSKFCLLWKHLRETELTLIIFTYLEALTRVHALLGCIQFMLKQWRILHILAINIVVVTFFNNCFMIDCLLLVEEGEGFLFFTLFWRNHTQVRLAQTIFTGIRLANGVINIIASKLLQLIWFFRKCKRNLHIICITILSSQLNLVL